MAGRPRRRALRSARANPRRPELLAYATVDVTDIDSDERELMTRHGTLPEVLGWLFGVMVRAGIYGGEASTVSHAPTPAEIQHVLMQATRELQAAVDPDIAAAYRRVALLGQAGRISYKGKIPGPHYDPFYFTITISPCT